MNQSTTPVGPTWCINLLRVVRHLRLTHMRPIAPGLPPATAVIEFEAAKVQRALHKMPIIKEHDLLVACKRQGVDRWEDVGVVGRDPSIGAGDLATLTRLVLPLQMSLMMTSAHEFLRFLESRGFLRPPRPPPMPPVPRVPPVTPPTTLQDICDSVAKTVTSMYDKTEALERSIFSMAAKHEEALNNIRRHACIVHVAHHAATQTIDRQNEQIESLQRQVAALASVVMELRTEADASMGLALLGDESYLTHHQAGAGGFRPYRHETPLS